MPSAQDIASKMAYISGRLTAGGRNKEMLEWLREYKKLKEELEEAKATEATASDTTAKKILETTAPETMAEVSQTKARRVAFKEPVDHDSPDEEVVKVAAGNENGKEMITLRLDQRRDKITITEKLEE